MVAGKGGITKPIPIPIHPEIAKLAARMPAYGWWFPSNQRPGQHVDPRSMSLTITNALRQCGSAATAHQLRNTAATRMQRQSRDIRLTQSMLRHQHHLDDDVHRGRQRRPTPGPAGDGLDRPGSSSSPIASLKSAAR